MRLIDADVLIEEMKKTETEYENAMTCPSWWSAFNVISEQPTAYDIDKVVEELEQKKEEVQRMRNTCVALSDLEVCDIENVTYERSIEIVKQGGVDDDVCEWKFEDEEANLYLTGCQQRQLIFDGTPKENWYRYCPYCGKKIKIVGD